MATYRSGYQFVRYCKHNGINRRKYPNLQRDRRFAQLSTAHVEHFKTILTSPNSIIENITTHSKETSSDLLPFNADWMRKYRGCSQVVLQPSTTAQVSQILSYCNEHSLAVVPQGGNTGLVGGSVPVFDEIVLSTARLNQIRDFDEVSGTLVLDAGCILEVADKYLAERGYIFPLDLGAKGSCHIGGNVATNAGGLRLLRYGSLHGSVVGLEAVLPDGTVVDDLGKLRKNNTGYDLKQLFIGSEGTLGVITAISIVCPPRPKAVNVAYVGVEDFTAVRETFKKAKAELGEILSAFELMDGRSQELVAEVKGAKRPLESEPPFYCLIETSGSVKEHDDAKLGAFLESAMESGLVADGVLAENESQVSSLWSWREGIPEVLGHWGGVYKYDVSIPLPELYRLVEDTRARLRDAKVVAEEGQPDEDNMKKPVYAVVGYGHMGDSNLHLNVAVRGYDKQVEGLLEPWIYEWIQKRGGSISAEHGLGLAKKEYIGYSRSDTMIDLMKRIKGFFDPEY
ncbi:MAG: hypothetical protein M1814_005092 [Vezdaea aestivalis]|nr:MAG: hypothetical protein M1814_005092 [Vezdaea aestivalis]